MKIKRILQIRKQNWIGRKQAARLGQQSGGKRPMERRWLKYPGSLASKKRQNRLESSALFFLGQEVYSRLSQKASIDYERVQLEVNDIQSYTGWLSSYVSNS